MNGRYVVFSYHIPEVHDIGVITAMAVPSAKVVIGISILWVIWYM